MTEKLPPAILVLGSANTDLVIRAPRLPRPGETVLGGEFFQAAGGKGANQAVAAARLGARVTFLAAVGDDEFGRTSLAGYQREGIDCQFIRKFASAATGTALILVDRAGENLIGVASGANALLTADDVDRVPADVFQSAQVFLTSLETPLPTVVRGLERAKEAGLTTVLNPAPAAIEVADRRVLSLVDVLTPNEGEAAALAGDAIESNRTSDAIERAQRAGERLRSLGTIAVVITLGAEGCLVVAEEVTHLPGLNVQAVDATAAGDAFNGALAVALAEGKPLIDAARWANRIAAVAVSRVGAQPSLPRREEIQVLP